MLDEKLDDVLPAFPDAGLFKMGVVELVINAIEHGNGFDGAKKAYLNIFIIADQHLVAHIKDAGRGFNWWERVDASVELAGEQERGRGVAMTSLCCDHLVYNNIGNEVWLIKKIGGG